MKKLAILFPGVGYGFAHPLLYYADLALEAKGFERLYMRYQDIFFEKELSFEEKAAEVRKFVMEQAKGIDFSSYDEKVFVSKSIGSTEAGVLAHELSMEVTQIFLTPVEAALPYCNSDSYVVMGTLDEAYPVYKEHCEKNGVKALFVDGANHSLEVEGQPLQSLDILKQVMAHTFF